MVVAVTIEPEDGDRTEATMADDRRHCLAAAAAAVVAVVLAAVRWQRETPLRRD